MATSCLTRRRNEAASGAACRAERRRAAAVNASCRARASSPETWGMAGAATPGATVLAVSVIEMLLMRSSRPGVLRRHRYRGSDRLRPSFVLLQHDADVDLGAGNRRWDVDA